jgi:hypothetical protein
MLEFRASPLRMADDDYSSTAISIAVVGFACVQRRRQPRLCMGTIATAEGP